MSDPLAIYLHDHLAGAALAIELLESMRDQHAGKPLGRFATGLLVEIEADRDVLRGLSERAGAGSNAFKELSAWLAERLSRVKLSGQREGNLETFEALEFLQLGIHGKLALWRALAVAAASEARLKSTDFSYLAARAQEQENSVEQQPLGSGKNSVPAGSNIIGRITNEILAKNLVATSTLSTIPPALTWYVCRTASSSRQPQLQRTAHPG